MDSIRNTVTFIGLFTLNCFAMNTSLYMPKPLSIPCHDPFKKIAECPPIFHLIPHTAENEPASFEYKRSDSENVSAYQEKVPTLSHNLIEVHFADSRPPNQDRSPSPQKASLFEEPLFFYIENNSSQNKATQALIVQAEYLQKNY